MTIAQYEEILNYLAKITSRTKWAGHLFAVGGCCRDKILGLDITDIDLAVDLPDGGVKFALWLRKTHRTLLPPVLYPRFGTAMFRLKKFPDVEIETVQTRKEKYTDKNSRCPAIAFGSIEEDCLRRDLTINSLYYDITNRNLLDLSGKAIHDIHNHLIRTPLCPDTTFDDDPVRIYRAIRFASKYNWEIDPDTLKGLKRNLSRLDIVSPNRARGELMKMLMSDKPSEAMQLLLSTGALKMLIPEILPLTELHQIPGNSMTVWQHTLLTLDAVPADPLLRVAALFHDIGKAYVHLDLNVKSSPYPCHDSSAAPVIRRVMRRLKFTTPFIADLKYLIINHSRLQKAGDNTERLIDRKLIDLYHTAPTPQLFDKLLQLIHADNISQPPSQCKPAQVPVIRKRLKNLL